MNDRTATAPPQSGVTPWPNAIVLFFLGQVITAAGTYGAIRADLREAIVASQTAVQRADQANARIDRMQEARPR